MSPCDPPTPPPPLSPAPWKQMGLKCHSRLRRLPQPLTLPHPHVRPDRSSPTQHNRREIQRDWGRARGSNRDSCGAEDSSDLLIRIWKTFVKEIVRWESKWHRHQATTGKHQGISAVICNHYIIRLYSISFTEGAVETSDRQRLKDILRPAGKHVILNYNVSVNQKLFYNNKRDHSRNLGKGCAPSLANFNIAKKWPLPFLSFPFFVFFLHKSLQRWAIFSSN